MTKPAMRRLAVAALAAFVAVRCGYGADLLTTISSEGEPGEETESLIPIETPSDSETQTDEGLGSDSTACVHGEIPPSEVLLIGDSWISLLGTRVEDLAKAGGVLGFGEDFAHRAAMGATIEVIVQQYEAALNDASASGVVKVVIMNGGGVDTYGGKGSSESILHVADTFSLFLARLAEEGVVRHVVYVLYSEGSSIPGIPELRPLMQAACRGSAVPCLLLDLQPVWEGHTDYISADTINPSPAGLDAIAATIWQTLKNNCIAQ